ncbi:hypothetical protein [Streptomyces sp. NPDC048057]|uniref:hypothetical protein n=1 Tax=Streptomyces sp. NPDC048057 TaxID=3155628 RepID=UPI0033F3B75B
MSQLLTERNIVISLDKTPRTIAVAKARALVGRELRKNNVAALAFVFGMRVHDAAAKAAGEVSAQ